MPNYNNGKIYKLVSQNTDMIYIGSTVQLLIERKKRHISDIKRGTGISSANMFIWGDCEIDLIENYPCNSKKELVEREQYYIDLYSDYCVNKNRAVSTEESNREIFKRYYRKSGKIKNKIDRNNNLERYRNYKRKSDKKNVKTVRNYYINNKDKIKIDGKKLYEKDKIRILERCKNYKAYLKSMGGDPKNNNCLARIDPTLFS